MSKKKRKAPEPKLCTDPGCEGKLKPVAWSKGCYDPEGIRQDLICTRCGRRYGVTKAALVPLPFNPEPPPKRQGVDDKLADPTYYTPFAEFPHDPPELIRQLRSANSHDPRVIRYDELMAAYVADDQERCDEFRADVLEELGLKDHPKAAELWKLACKRASSRKEIWVEAQILAKFLLS